MKLVVKKMCVKNKIRLDKKAVSNVIGTILMLAITVGLASVIFQMIDSQGASNEKTHVDLVASIDLNSSLEGGGGTIHIMHKGGDTLDDDKTAIYIDIDNQRIELKISDGIDWEGKISWDIGEKWSKYFSEITKDTKVNVMVIDIESNEILMRGDVQAGLSFPDHNPPIISFSWCEPSMVPEDGTIPFKLFSAIVDSENNMASGTVTVNLLSIFGNEAEPMFDFDNDGVYETKSLKIRNETSIGIYTFEITAKDSYGNKAKGNVNLEVGSLDTISPTVEITQPSVNAFVDSRPEIIGSFADNIGGSGIDESSISLKIDNEEVTIEESNITSSSIIYMPETPLGDGIHTTTLSLRDKAGNVALASLTFVTGGYLESYCMGGAQNFIILNQEGIQTTNFLEGDIVRIRVSSVFVENTESKNRVTIYNISGNSTIIDPAFTLISNTAPYLFYDYCYACTFDAPNTGFYKIKMEIIDSNGYKFSVQANITVGSSTIPYYFKTYSDSSYSDECNTFNSEDTIYVRIVITEEKGQVNNDNSDNIYIDDYILNHQIQNKPGDGAISEVGKSGDALGYTIYKFSINLSKNQFGWLQSANWYTLSIQDLKNNDNDLIFKGATQVQIINSGKPDLDIEDNDVTLSNDNPTLGDNVYISVIVHNVGIIDAFNVVVGIWDDNGLIGEDTIPIIFANGGDEEISVLWSVRDDSTTNLVIVVDPYYTIGEYDETNNLINKQVEIRFPILLVDDDDGNGESWNVHIENYWTDALDSVGYLYNMVTVPHGENGPDFNFMKDYGVVIWFSGRDNYGVGASLTSIDQSNLAMYLEDGGNFWMISQSLLYVLCNFDDDAPLTNPFAHEYLKVDDRSEDEGTRNPLPGVNGDPITDGLSYETSAAIFNGNDYCDDIKLEPDGDGIFYGPGAHYCAVRYDSGSFKVVFFALEFTFIVNPNDRAELVEKTLDWIGVNPISNDVGITSLECSENVQINKEVNITANVKNFGRNDQYDFDVLCQITAQNGTAVYSNTKVLSLNSKEETVTVWQWTPDTEGTYIVSVSTQLNGDEDMTNNESSRQINVLVFCDDMENGMNGWTSDGTMLTTMFFEDFESGDLNNWDTFTSGGGTVTSSNTEAYSGTYCVKFYGDGSASNDMYIERSFNFTGKTNVFLTWYWHDEDLESADKGYLSIWDGTWDNNVITIWDGTDGDHVTSPMNYEARGDPMLIKLDEYYNMIDGFKIRFGCTAVHGEVSDCLLIDEIKVSTYNTGNLWHQVDTRAHTSNTSFWCGEDSTTRYVGYLNNSLITPEIDLTSGTSATLKFWHYCDFEGQTSNIDGGIVEITTDNGSTWTQLTPVNGYDEVLEEDGVNPLGGKEAFCYDNDWVEEEIDITPYIGNSVKIRFHFGSSPTLNDEGWFIDDVSVYRW